MSFAFEQGARFWLRPGKGGDTYDRWVTSFDVYGVVEVSKEKEPLRAP